MKKLIAAPGEVAICNECVELCQEILAEDPGTKTTDTAGIEVAAEPVVEPAQGSSDGDAGRAFADQVYELVDWWLERHRTLHVRGYLPQETIKKFGIQGNAGISFDLGNTTVFLTFQRDEIKREVE